MSVPLPALDPYLVSIGEPVEDLSRVARAQPFTTAGPVVDRAALEAFASARRRVRGDVPEALVRAGLVGTGGRFTDAGRHVAAYLTASEGRVRVESGRGHAPLSLEAYLRGGRALVVATAAPGTFDQVPRGDAVVEAGTTLTLDVVDGAAVPAMIAAWVGLGPAWSLATSPADVPEALLVQRVDDPRTPPPDGADAHLRHVWGQPWFLWTLAATGNRPAIAAVNAGPSGHYVLTAPGPDAAPEHLGLHAVLSAALWLEIVETVARARD